MTSIYFSIVLLNYKGLHHVKECLESISLQTEMNFEIIYVDNDSQDDSVTWVQQFLLKNNIPGQALQTGANLGFAGGNNYALPYCQGEWIFFLNNDTVMDSSFTQNFKVAISSYPNYQVFGPILMQYTEPHLIDSAGDGLYTAGPAFQYLHGMESAQLPSQPYEVLSACGGAACYHRDVILEVGGFDEDFWLLFEDVDLGIRARNHGYVTLMLPELRIFHKGGESIGKVSPLRYHFEMRNIHWVRVKNYPFLTLLKFWPVIFLQSILGLGFALCRGQLLQWVKFKVEAWKRFPSMWKRRTQARSMNPLSRHQFEKLLRHGWFRQRLKNLIQPLERH